MGDENIIHVEKRKAVKDLGYVGTITSINKEALHKHLQQGHITVVSPMGISIENQPHNINADEVASAVAISLEAEKLVLLTNVQGVMRNPEDESSLISSLTLSQISDLIKRQVIHGGMIPKVNACVSAVNGGVKKAHIIDARIQHALLLEIFTDKGIGTQILKEQPGTGNEK
jgi:acetylglutamate kinase